MQQGQQGGFPERKKNALNHNKLNLVTKCPTAEGKLSKMSWQIHKNNPRLTVYTGDPADESTRTNNGKIQAELDTPHVFALFAKLRKIMAGPADQKEAVECKNFIFPGGQRSKEPVITSRIWIGKDKEGVMYISLVDAIHQQRPVIKFDFLPGAGGDWIRFMKADGSKESNADASLAYCEGYLKALELIFAGLAITEFEPYVPKQPGGGFGGQRQGGGGGGYGGGNRQGGGGGYGGGPAAGGGDVAGDDDLPF